MLQVIEDPNCTGTMFLLNEAQLSSVECPRIDPCRDLVYHGEAQKRFYEEKRKEVRRKTCLVGFGHRAQQGKDTVVAHIENLCYPGVSAKRYAFADALKIELYEWLRGAQFLFSKGLSGSPEKIGVWPFHSTHRSDTEKIKWIDENKTFVRHILQYWGTEYRRAQDSLYWVKQLQKRVELEQPNFALIPDMRFKNEAAICDFTVNVRRKGFAPVGGIHVSETEMDDYPYDFVIEAEEGDFRSLYDQAERVFFEIMQRKVAG